MNFGNEYKKAVQDISPDRAALDRMKASVMAEVKGRKKPLPLGKIAVSCGSVAACAAIIITAAVLIPHNDASNMTAGEPASAPSMAEIAVDSSAADFDNGEAFDDDIAEDTAADITEDCFDDDKSYDNAINNAADNAADTIITPNGISNDSASKSDDILEEVTADETETAEPNDDSAMNPAAGDGATSDNFYDDTADDKIADDEIGTDSIYDDVPDMDIMDDEDFDCDDIDDGIDASDNEIANDFDYDEDIYDEIDDCDDDISDDEDSLPSVEKAKFSADKSELRLVMYDGSRLDFILIDPAVDVPVNTPLEKFTDSSGTEYYLQCSGIYLVLYDSECNFIAVYRVN